MIFNLQLFGGGGKKSKVSHTEAHLPEASVEEKGLLQNQLNWINGANASANRLQGMGDGALNNAVTPNYQDMYNSYLAANNGNQNALAALQNQVSSAGTRNLTDNTKYAQKLGAATDRMVNNADSLANEYNGAVLKNQTAMNDITQGNIPEAYAKARQTALNNDLQSTVGNALSGLASRGIINSSQADSAINDISKNATNALAAQYTQDINTAANLNNQAYTNALNGIGAKMNLWGNQFNNQQSGIMNQAALMNQGYANQVNNAGTAAGLVGQREGLAAAPISTGSSTQQAAIQPAKDYYTMAQLNNSDNEDLLKAYMQGRYGLAAPAQTTVRQGSGGFLGGFMSGFCFAKGTEVATVEGSKPIEEVITGDKVVSLGKVLNVIAMHEMGESPTVRLNTEDTGVVTTASEKVLTNDGLKLVSEVEVGEPIMTVHGWQKVTSKEDTGITETVYELECDGDNLFYANGILAEGISQDELQALSEGEKKKGSKKGEA